MGLQIKLNDMKKQIESSIPPEAVSIMNASTESLMQSEIMNHVLKKGDQAPEFTLPNEDSVFISSSDLLRQGPLVISFYRGTW